MNLRDAAEQGLDLLLVDEAHRLRKDSNTRFTPKAKRANRSQIEELLAAAKVTVFLLDENQFVRPDEIGSTKIIEEETRRLGVPLKTFDLETQFRCGGCRQYSDWIDYLLGFKKEKPRPWGSQFQFSLAENPTELDSLLLRSKNLGETARLVAGFCWKWNDPLEDDALVNDVTIGEWQKPWNAKAINGRTYKPKNHPYTKWANSEIGESQIGCIYSAQGFEFDRVGVIWGLDLVWRSGKWVSQPKCSFDNRIKEKNTDSLTLIKNAYRVLLTRGMRETLLLCLDPETKSHIANELLGMQ